MTQICDVPLFLRASFEIFSRQALLPSKEQAASLLTSADSSLSQRKFVLRFVFLGFLYFYYLHAFSCVQQLFLRLDEPALILLQRSWLALVLMVLELETVCDTEMYAKPVTLLTSDNLKEDYFEEISESEDESEVEEDGETQPEYKDNNLKLAPAGFLYYFLL